MFVVVWQHWHSRMVSDDNTSINDPLVGGQTHRDPMIGMTLDGRFRIDALLGTGGMSNVYRATQLRVNREVAIKTLKFLVDSQPVYKERFQREIDLLCALAHPNIVTVYDCIIGPDGQPCLVMDYLRGRSLERLLEEEGPLNIERFGRIFAQVCSALDYAHRKGVVHRDIKPGNVVLLDEETDIIKVVDFGVAKFNQESRRLTMSGELWGSPPYMSPEQCMGKPDDERSDLYSLGIVMYEMLTGRDPYHECLTIFELIQAHVNTPPPSFREKNPFCLVSPDVEAVIFKAIAKDPAERYQSANQLRDALVKACTTSGNYGTGANAVVQSNFPQLDPTAGLSGSSGTAGGGGRSGTAGGTGGRAGTGGPGVDPALRARWGQAGGDSGETSNKLAESGEKTEGNCDTCGKPIHKQRRGSMTSWILADHYEVMERISGACDCNYQSESGNKMQAAQATGPARTKDTRMVVAERWARQSGSPSSGEQSNATGPQLFADSDLDRTASGNQSGTGYGSTRGTSGSGGTASGSSGGADRNNTGGRTPYGIAGDSSTASGGGPSHDGPRLSSKIRDLPPSERPPGGSLVKMGLIVFAIALLVCGTILAAPTILAGMKGQQAATDSAQSTGTKTDSPETASDQSAQTKPDGDSGNSSTVASPSDSASTSTPSNDGSTTSVKTSKPVTRSTRSTTGRPKPKSTSATKRATAPARSAKPAAKPASKKSANPWDALRNMDSKDPH